MKELVIRNSNYSDQNELAAVLRRYGSYQCRAEFVTELSLSSSNYAAFIRYRHVEPDRKWVKWPHSALETYRTPKQLVSENSSRDWRDGTVRGSDTHIALREISRTARLKLLGLRGIIPCALQPWERLGEGSAPTAGDDSFRSRNLCTGTARNRGTCSFEDPSCGYAG